MANPRQRRKTRSASHKPVKQSRKTNKLLKKHRPIKGSKVLQEAWDSKKTVRQNYAALGLVHSLDPTDSGGRDITHVAGSGSSSHQSTEPILNRGASTAQPEIRTSLEASRRDREAGTGSLRHGTGRIIRDETGAIVDVVLAEDVRESAGGEDAASDSMVEDVNGFEIGEDGPRVADRERGQEAAWLLCSVGEDAGGREDEKARAIVQALEVEASSTVSKTPRSTSSAELKHLQSLQHAYGADFGAMAKDRKRNVQQYSAGQLRRAFKKARL